MEGFLEEVTSKLSLENVENLIRAGCVPRALRTVVRRYC